jgi:hypothetical protein
MTETVGWDTLRELAAFRAESGYAVSLYLDLDPSVAPTPGNLSSHLTSLLDAGERSVPGGRPLPHRQRVALRADFDRIRDYFENGFSRDGAHGLALFADGLDDLWSAHLLAEQVPDAVKVNRHLYLAPLVPLLGRGDGAIVAVAGRERGDVYRLRGGRLEEVADLTEEQPRRHDQGGWAQARMQRHVDTLAQEHLRAVAEELDRQVGRQLGLRIVMVAAEEARAELDDFLAHQVRSAIVGWTQAEAHAGPAEVL